MSARPSDEDFNNWALSDQNKSKMQNALRTYSDLVNIKNEVRC